MKTEITRMEIINHSQHNDMEVGRQFVYYSKKNEEIKIEYQDGGKTVKIFISKKKNMSKTDNPLDENGYPIYGTFRKKQTAMQELGKMILTFRNEADKNCLFDERDTYDDVINLIELLLPTEREQMEMDCKKSYYAGFEESEKGDANCFTGWREFFPDYYNQNYGDE